MVQWANVALAPISDARLYCQNVNLTGTESDLNPTLSPVPVLYSQALAASVVLTLPAPVTSNSAWVVLQQDLGDGNWRDVSWLLWTATSGSSSWELSAGEAAGGAYQQTRTPGSAPAASGARTATLGGRIRFVGAATLNPISAQLLVTIYYRLLGLR
jgi:hypothetical protein